MRRNQPEACLAVPILSIMGHVLMILTIMPSIPKIIRNSSLLKSKT